ncbi:hypothetical protein MSS88_07295 [bacterium]|uniref:hypothetical protein n=1 Tax=Gemmiger sp. TaxID=2049027 RepID=UPI002A920422|nr:hypothetical protein [Gemmiger sp.]MCI6885116.1 hypothetical protein [bacterium]MCI7192579.1 hypothetical protein [bacterium]MCI7324902.1 hypothetical protein [bacterium]MCI7744594.1 hypothetical protein [bacterium]MDD6718672.1 hypothetical protein [bacterium]
MVFCKQCGLLAPARVQRCPRCGAPLPPAPRRPVCGQGAAEGPVYASPSHGEDEDETMPTWQYVVMMLIFSLPVIGLFMMIWWSCGDLHYIERVRLARACLIQRILADLLVVALVLLLFSAANTMVLPLLLYH